jgi:two-component system phosphate regulon response regulator PhoB
MLVVEDDEAVANMLCYLLEDQGWGCIRSADAEEAWRLIAAELPRAAVVDLRLPGKDGWWLLRRIRTDSRTRRLPVVLITGFLDDEVASRATEMASEWLSKPFTFAALTEKMEHAAELASALPELPPR